MYIYRFLSYQISTKAYDKDFIVEVTEDNIDEIIEVFTRFIIWFVLISSRKFFNDEQDFLKWNYILSDKVYRECEPYLTVLHRDLNFIQSTEVYPRYYKNTRKLKIVPNLYDLENFELFNRLENREPYFKKHLYRNCLLEADSKSNLLQLPILHEIAA